jgi:acetyl-CoA C-acetyltransferase
MSRPAWIAGVGNTRLGRLEGQDTLDIMSAAAASALADAGYGRGEVDGLLTGYSTSMPHIMLATLFAEHFGIKPDYCHAIQLGGATGCALVMLAKLLVESGQCETVLVVAGENRLTNPGGRDSAIQTLAQVGHAEFEVPYGGTIPAYYGLLASAYMHRYGLTEQDLAEAAVLMRAHAADHPDAHLQDRITVLDVMASRAIASPLKFLDCCPISDGGIAVLVTADPDRSKGIKLAGAGQAHRHQHVSMATDLSDFGAARAARQALRQAACDIESIDMIGIYDSFTITLLILLEEIGFSARGQSGYDLRSGRYGRGGRLPLNTHGGLLSFGHSGVAGGMAHLVELCRQMAGEAESRQVARRPGVGFIHGDGGVLSSHVSLVLTQE